MYPYSFFGPTTSIFIYIYIYIKIERPKIRKLVKTECSILLKPNRYKPKNIRIIEKVSCVFYNL